MTYRAEELEMQAVLQVAAQMCAAARTAPKARGVDCIHTLVVTGQEKDSLAEELRRLGNEMEIAFYLRDADCLDKSQAVVLIGSEREYRGLGSPCAYCGHGSCEGCAQAGGHCVYGPMDLGIALGSAVGAAADHRVDNRILYSAGKAALSLRMMDENVDIIMAVPLSVTGKSPFFDRKKKS
ncbi:MAG: ferredoxin [Clostridia bacterium]|nr:ferredoxin [Clostridia bacterium]